PQLFSGFRFRGFRKLTSSTAPSVGDGKNRSPPAGGRPQQGSGSSVTPPSDWREFRDVSRHPRGSARMLTRVSVPIPLACLATASLLMATACGSNPRIQKNPAPDQTAATAAPAQATPAVDPVATLIASSQQR